jgi:ABC-2 type transport system ATP-binding protein
VVRVEGDRDGQWARSLAGVKVSEVGGGQVRLVLDAATDSDLVLRAAMAAGRVTEFSFGRRRLSEVFREALT